MAKRAGTAVADEPTVEDSAVEAEVEAAEIEAAEVEAEAEVEVAAEDGDSSAETETPAEKIEEVIDLSGIDFAITTLLASEDLPSDPAERDYSGVVAAYSALTRKGKTAATKYMNDQSRVFISGEGEGGVDIDLARTWLLAQKATQDAKAKTSTPRTPTDPTEAFISRLAPLQVAYAAIVEQVPENVNPEWQNKLAALVQTGISELPAVREWMEAGTDVRGDAPAVSVAALAAGKLAFTTKRKPYGARHDVATHISQVMLDDSVEVGTFFTAKEIAGRKSEEYGEDNPTMGQVTAKLESGKYAEDGVAIETVDGSIGARRVEIDLSATADAETE